MIERRIARVMSQVLGIPAELISETTTSETVAKWDSLGHMNLCMALEEEFGVAFDAEQVVEMTSFPAIVAQLRKLAEPV